MPNETTDRALNKICTTAARSHGGPSHAQDLARASVFIASQLWLISLTGDDAMAKFPTEVEHSITVKVPVARSYKYSG